jgi:tetratricopeptide (TPR) repeat protein
MRQLIFILISWLLAICSPILAQNNGLAYIENASYLLKINSRESAYMLLWRNSQKLPDSLRTGQQLFFEGSVYASKNQINQMAAYYKKAAHKDPTLQGMIGYDFLSNFHDPTTALRYFEAFDARTPNFDDISANDPISYRKGLAYAMLNNHVEALRQFDKGLGAIEVKHGAEWVNYRFFVARAISYLELKQPEPALADLAKALKNYDRSAIARFYQGVAYQQMGRIAEAKVAYDDARFRMQYIRYQQGDYNEGLIYDLYEGQIDDALKTLKP